MANRETLTSRERVKRAVSHEPVDRMPIDLGGHGSTSISAFAYQDLREYLNLPKKEIEIADMVQFTPRIHEDILARFHCDCIRLQPEWSKTSEWSPRGRYIFQVPSHALPSRNKNGDWTVDFNGTMRMPANGYFFDGDWLDLENRSPDKALELTAKEAERIFNETDYYTIYRNFNAFFHEGDMDWQCRMLTDPDGILQEQQELLDRQILRAEKVIRRMGKYIQAIAVGSDLGLQSGPAINPVIYNELCAPYLKKFCNYIHDNSELKIFMHCCGSIKQFIPVLIECGIDILNPVQISANDMNPAELKKTFGEKITFWGGGCNAQFVLNKGTVEDVSENVRELVNIFKANSGYVFTSVHNIMGNIPPEKITVMYDTAYAESFYD